MRELTLDDILYLKAAIFQTDKAHDNRTLLECEGLSYAPKPDQIKNRFLAVFGYIFHAIVGAC